MKAVLTALQGVALFGTQPQSNCNDCMACSTLLVAPESLLIDSLRVPKHQEKTAWAVWEVNPNHGCCCSTCSTCSTTFNSEFPNSC